MESKLDRTSLYQEACKHLVGGVNSPVRAFRAVGGEPFFVAHASGAKLYDTEGHAYTDYVMSWGAHILGHAHPDILSALGEACERGTSFGAPTGEEVALAKLVKEAFPSMEKVRLVSSGTEAVMGAVRLARGFTGRKKIVKFSGCYHGHSDSLLVKAGSGGLTFGVPDSRGVPEELARLTVSLPYNELEPLEVLLAREGKEIACVIVEPVAANMGLVPPRAGFLAALREMAARHGVLVIFDEVITGFRLAFGGAQEFFEIEADLTCLGKILGGGLPLAAFGGKEIIMRHLAPEGDVYQAGTLSGNPLATAAGISVLSKLKSREIYRRLERKRELIVDPLEASIRDKKYPVTFQSLGSLFTLFFCQEPVTDYESAKRSSTAQYAKFFHELLRRGVFFPPSQFETCFLSLAHSEDDLAHTVQAVRESLARVFR